MTPAASPLQTAEGLLAVASLLDRRDKEVECRISGDSMGATIPDGSRVRIRLARGGPWEIGDVVAFVAGRKLVAHRVVHRPAGHLITRGDGRRLPDPPVSVESVLGSVTAVEVGGRWESPGPPPQPQILATAALSALRALLAVDASLARRFARRLMAGSAWLRRRRS